MIIATYETNENLDEGKYVTITVRHKEKQVQIEFDTMLCCDGYEFILAKVKEAIEAVIDRKDADNDNEY